VTGHRSGAPPGKGAGAGANRPRNVERPPSGSDAARVTDASLDPDDPTLIEACDWVLEHGEYLVRDADGLVLLSDTFVVEGIVNGLEPLPETARLARADGRTVYVFRVPKAWAA
jgi:hypothetical protein